MVLTTKISCLTMLPAPARKMTRLFEFTIVELILSKNIKVTFRDLRLLSYPHNVNLNTRLRLVETLTRVVSGLFLGIIP